MFTTLFAFGAASFVVVSAVPIDMNSGLSPTSTLTSDSHIPTSTSLSAAPPSALLDLSEIAPSQPDRALLPKAISEGSKPSDDVQNSNPQPDTTHGQPPHHGMSTIPVPVKSKDSYGHLKGWGMHGDDTGLFVNYLPPGSFTPHDAPATAGSTSDDKAHQ
ncbi:hypothetical protein F5880DRAFT_1610872 [Lentinula raphanica]|nr:hypothetical protein F5880DRAFT_1610872 [Lentinula raphanica]